MLQDKTDENVYWSEIPRELWTHQIWPFLEYGQIFNSIRLVCLEWNDWFLHHTSNYILNVKMNRIDILSFAKCCKQMYFNNIGGLDIKGIEYAIQVKDQSVQQDQNEQHSTTTTDSIQTPREDFNPLEYFPNISILKMTITNEKTVEYVSSQIVNKKYLNDLDLKMNLITRKGLKTFLSQPNVLMNLTRLDLSNNRLVGNALDLIVDSTMLSNLKYLNLSNNKLNSAFDSIWGSTFKDSLQELHVSNCSIPWHILKRLLLCFEELTYLDISLNEVEKAFSNIYKKLQSESDPQRFYKLVKLNLSGTKLKNETMEFIAKIPIFSELTHLDLSRNKISKIGTEKLADETTSVLTKLQYLDLSRCGIGKEGAQNIRKSSIFSSLQLFIE